MNEKQTKQLEACQTVLNKYGVEVKINEAFPKEIKEYALDIEHDERGELVCIGCLVPQSTYYFFNDLGVFSSCFLTRHKIIAHNGCGDIEALQTWGVNASQDQLTWDTMLIGHIIDPSLKAYGLKDMAKRELQIEYPSYEDIVGKRGLKTPRVTLDQQPPELVRSYNACDCLVTWLLYKHQKKAIPDYDLCAL